LVGGEAVIMVTEKMWGFLLQVLGIR